MKKVFEKIIEKLEEQKVKGIYDSSSIIGEKNVWAKAIEIVKQEAEQYEECYKDCGDCEAYNKEKYHCPKFCKVIKETVKEIEENNECTKICDLKINGKDLIKAGLRGEEVGKALDTALDAVIEGKVVNNRNDLLTYIL